jgi:Cytochrome c554 and c-prime
MTTFNPELTFRMEARDGHFYETAIRHENARVTERKERIDLVIGSATKGQTYLYWKQNGLFELPVSYWTQLDRWVNSPGYVDGSADFDRPVLPRCLECHAAYFQPMTSAPSENRYAKDNFVLGISCERCHGPGAEHVENHSANSARSTGTKPMPPLRLSRDRQVDVCAQCHGGAGEPIAPAFSFRPGEPLSDYVRLQPPNASDRLDVHGNQVNLLERSRCFQGSPEMSCSTCHDVHEPERAAPDYSAKCLGCHRVDQCGMVRKVGTRIASNCIDCHMPVQASNKLVLDADNQRLQANVRNHWIRVYQNVSPP